MFFLGKSKTSAKYPTRYSLALPSIGGAFILIRRESLALTDILSTLLFGLMMQ